MAPHKAGAAKVNEVFYAGEYHPIQAGSIDGTDITAHDNGVYRALLASTTGLYDPTGDCKAVGDPYCTIFVGHLSRCTTEETLHQAMSNYGKLKNLCLVRHIVTGASRGYAFVEFENEKDYLHAYEAAHHSTIDGSQIVVDYNRQQLMPGWIPRRLGGGLGGRKESGQLRFGGRERPFRAPLREIPYEELKKLGIPLPPEGHYMSRYQIPPPPRRKSGNREDHQYKNSSDQRSYFLKEEAEHSQQSRDVEYSRERRERREQYSKVGKHMIGSSRYSPEGSDPSRDDSRRSKHSRSQEEDAGRYDSHKRSYEEYRSRQDSHHKSTHRRDDNKYENHDARYGSRHRRSYEEDDDPRNDFDDKPHNESRSSRSGHDKRSKHHSKRSKHGERDS